MAGDTIIVDGIKYYNEAFAGKLDGVFFDNFHIILHRKEVEIKGKKCFMCGETFKQNELQKHHAIPKFLKSVYNVHIQFCNDCHRKFHRKTKHDAQCVNSAAEGGKS